MEGQRIFFSKKEGVYYYVTYGNYPLCGACNEEINKTLVYQTIWMKRSEDIKTYHVLCFKKIQLRGYIDELKTCVVVEEIPDDVLPIFERRPTLANISGSNTSEVFKILKGSEAEVKDRTKISRNQTQYQSIGYQENLNRFKKRDEELGLSGPLLSDIRKDEIMQKKNEYKRKYDFISCKIISIEDNGIKVEYGDKERTIERKDLPKSSEKYNVGDIVNARVIRREPGGILFLSLKDVNIKERKRSYKGDQDGLNVTVYDEEGKLITEENILNVPEIKVEEMDGLFEKVKNSKILPPQVDVLELLYSEKGDNKKIEEKKEDSKEEEPAEEEPKEEVSEEDNKDLKEESSDEEDNKK